MPAGRLVLLKLHLLPLVPVPRRFDRRPPERDTTRINERIRVPQVRLIGADGEQLGIVDINEALQTRPGGRPRPGRGRRRLEAAGHPPARLLEVQIRAGAEAEAGAQAPAAGQHPRNQAAAEDRAARLQHQEGPRRALPPTRRQGQNHDHVPRPRAGPSGARSGAAAEALRGPRRDRRDRVGAAAGRPQHEHAAGAEQRGLAEGPEPRPSGAEAGRDAASADVDAAPGRGERLRPRRDARRGRQGPRLRAMLRGVASRGSPSLTNSLEVRAGVAAGPPHGRSGRQQPGSGGLTMSAMRSAAWPSQRGGGSGVARGPRAGEWLRGCWRSRPGRGRAACWCRRHGDRALGVGAQGEAGDAEVGRLLLDPAGVGEDGAGVGEQGEEVEVAERVDQEQARGCSASRRLHHLAGARVDREDDRHLPASAAELLDGLGEQRPVDERGPVQGDEQRRSRARGQLRRRPGRRDAVLPARPACRSSCCRRSASVRRRIPSARRFPIASSEWRKRSEPSGRRRSG